MQLNLLVTVQQRPVDAVASVVETTNLVTGEVVNRENQSDDLWFYWGTGDEHEALRFAYRFDNVQIPANATVTEATVSYTHLTLPTIYSV